MRESSERIRYLTDGERQRLLKSCEQDYLRMIVIIALNTGFRKGEITNLKWKDIDMENNLIHLVEELGDDEKGSIKNGKRRTMHINDELREAILSWREKGDKTDWNDKVFYVEDVKKSFKTALKKADIKNFHFHDLRHDFASRLVAKGTDIVTVSKLLGHSDIKITMKYAHSNDTLKKSAVNKLCG